MGTYTEKYNGSEFLKKSDSSWYYFSGTHSFEETLGMDLPDYIFSSITWEFQLPVYPSKFSNYQTTADSVGLFEANSSGTAYPEIYQRVEHTYDSLGNIVEETFKKLEESEWVNTHRYLYEHGDDPSNEGLIITVIYQQWETDDWKNVKREVSEYAGQGLSVFTMYNWNSSVANWQGSDRYNYDYDVNGNCKGELHQKYSSSMWTSNSKYYIEYNEQNQITYLEYSKITDGSWQYRNRYQIDYDSDGLFEGGIYQVYNTETEEWEDDARAEYTYSDGKKQTYIQEMYRGGEWKNEVQSIYNYNSVGLLTDIIGQAGNETGTDWVNYQKILFEYNDSNRISSLTKEDWDLASTAWIQNEGNEKWHFLYGISEEPSSNIEESLVNFVVYPNPAQTVLNISISWYQPQTMKISILDINGKSWDIKTFESNYNLQTSVDISHLPNGTYFLSIQTNEGNNTIRKFQVIR